MREEYLELQRRLKTERPGEWDMLPDIELYMDQVTAYMPRQHIGLKTGEMLTSAMVNNYVKEGLLPRAKGKKYERRHIASLTAISLLKNILPIGGVGTLLNERVSQSGPEDWYARYIALVNSVMDEMAEELECASGDFGEDAMRFAVKSYFYKYLSRCMVENMAPPSAAEARKSTKAPKKKSAQEKQN